MILRRLAIGVLLLGVAGAPAVPALADPERQPVEVVLQGLAPAIPVAGDTLRIRGLVVNRSETTVRAVSLQLRSSSEPILKLDSAARTQPVPGTEEPLADSLAPGESASFSAAVAVDAMPFGMAGTYPLVLEVAGIGADGNSTIVGELATVLPWAPDPIEPLALVWLWPLAAQPNRDADGVFLNDRTALEMAPGGRLDEILRAGADRDVTWVVDPELLQSASVMAQGYQVFNGDRITIGQQGGAAQAWLSGMQRVAASADLRVVPYADIDAVASRRAGLSTDVVRAVTQAPAVADMALGIRTKSPAYWAPFGRLDQDTATLLASAGTELVMLSGRSGDAPLAAFGTSTGSLTAVLVDPDLAAIVSAPTPTPQDVLLSRQQFLARTLERAQSAPGAGVVIAPADLRWDPSPGLLQALLRSAQQADWVRLTPLDALLQPDTPLPRQRAGYGAAAKAAELPSGYMRKVTALNDSVAALGAILNNPAPVVAPFAEATLRAQSAAWRTAPKAADELLGLIRREVAETSGQVSVLTSGTITFSGDTGTVPISVSNGLDQPVTVSLVLRGQPAPRLLASPSKRVTIDPGRTMSIEVDVRVVGSGPIPAAVQLLTPQGTDFGAPAPLTITSTAYSRAAGWVVGAAFVAIAIFVIVGVTRRILKVRRSRSEQGSRTVVP